METAKTESPLNNIIQLDVFKKNKLQTCLSTQQQDETFIFESTKLFQFILNFIRENEHVVTDEELLHSLSDAFKPLTKEYNTFKIDL
mgnify:CR=1 FL=1